MNDKHVWHNCLQGYVTARGLGTWPTQATQSVQADAPFSFGLSVLEPLPTDRGNSLKRFTCSNVLCHAQLSLQLRNNLWGDRIIRKKPPMDIHRHYTPTFQVGFESPNWRREQSDFSGGSIIISTSHEEWQQWSDKFHGDGNGSGSATNNNPHHHHHHQIVCCL